MRVPLVCWQIVMTQSDAGVRKSEAARRDVSGGDLESAAEAI